MSERKHCLGNAVTVSLCLLMHVSAGHAAAEDVVWGSSREEIMYAVRGDVSPVVRQALVMFGEDMLAVTGQTARETAADKATIIITQLDKADDAWNQTLRAKGVAVDSLRVRSASGLIDAFALVENEGKIYAVGSNGRGTAYAVLELSRMAGVSPWVWWGDAIPEKKDALTVPAGYSTVQRASVEYRGIFLNDEDWSFRQWAAGYEHASPGMIGPETYKRIFQLLLRLRANALWPAMHTGTRAFFAVDGNKEMADSFSIVIGTSHCEPLLRNNVDEWKVSERGRYNYITNRQAVLDYWTERLKDVQGSDMMYTIGMRGIHDGSMEGVKTMEEKTTALQQVINDQRELLRTYTDSDITTIPQVFVPYKEVLDIYENGLDVPDDVILMWCDDNYGYLTRLSDSTQQRRAGGAGVYYHLSYWGRPHDYLWLTTTQPGLVYSEMRQAYDHNARKLWIVNVHDIKPAAYHLSLFLDMAWDINSVAADNVQDHLRTWLENLYGSAAAEALTPALTEYYRLCGIRKPEHTGWTQVELDKKTYSRGWSQVTDTEFSNTAFGDELTRYIADYSRVRRAVLDAQNLIRDDLQDSYFAHVVYPVSAAADMAVKMLEAQTARSFFRGQTDNSKSSRREKATPHARRSLAAYNHIGQLTDYYNNVMAGGKWKGSMSAMPRDLYVFFPPLLPFLPDSVPALSTDTIPAPDYTGMDDVVVRNASDFDNASTNVSPVQMLGHSMNAVPLQKGASLSYVFSTDNDGEATLYTAVIPTQSMDRGDIRYSVRVDDAEPDTISIKEPFRSGQWKKNVMRGQALNATDVNIVAGKHTIVIQAIDDHIIVDQWMLDFNKKRKFYVMPIKPVI